MRRHAHALLSSGISVSTTKAFPARVRPWPPALRSVRSLLLRPPPFRPAFTAHTLIAWRAQSSLGTSYLHASARSSSLVRPHTPDIPTDVSRCAVVRRTSAQGGLATMAASGSSAGYLQPWLVLYWSTASVASLRSPRARSGASVGRTGYAHPMLSAQRRRFPTRRPSRSACSPAVVAYRTVCTVSMHVLGV